MSIITGFFYCNLRNLWGLRICIMITWVACFPCVQIVIMFFDCHPYLRIKPAKKKMLWGLQCNCSYSPLEIGQEYMKVGRTAHREDGMIHSMSIEGRPSTRHPQDESLKPEGLSKAVWNSWSLKLNTGFFEEVQTSEMTLAIQIETCAAL